MSSSARSLPVSTTGEIDVELLAFVERYATNLARWDLLLFFGRNPSICDHAPSIAQHLGRHPQSIEKELEDLVYLGVLDSHPNGQGLTYQLSHVSAMQRAVIRLAQRFDGPRTADG